MPQRLGDHLDGYVGALQDGGVGVPCEVAGGQLGELELLPDAFHVLVDGLYGLVDVAGLLDGVMGPLVHDVEDEVIRCGLLLPPPGDDLLHVGVEVDVHHALVLDGLAQGLGPDEVDLVTGDVLVAEQGEVLYVHSVAQVGEDPHVPAPGFGVGGGLVFEYPHDLLVGEGLLYPSGGRRLVPVPAEGVVLLLEPALGDLPVEDRPDVPGVYADAR